MCQRNLTRRSIPATETVVKKMPVGSGPIANENNNSSNDSNMTARGLEFQNVTLQECYQLGGAEIKYDIPYVSAMWMGLAIPFGMIIGAVLALLTFRFCCQKIWREDSEEHENLIWNNDDPKWKKYLKKLFPFFFAGFEHQNISLEKLNKNKVRPAKSTQSGYEPLYNEAEVSSELEQGTGQKYSARSVDDVGRSAPGLADALMQTSANEVERELILQDVQALDSLEQSLTQSRNAFSEAITQVHLNQMSEGTKADQALIGRLMQHLHTKLAAEEQNIEIEYGKKLKELRADPTLTGDQEATKKGLNRLNTELRQRRHRIFKECVEDFRDTLKLETKLNEAQLSEFTSRLTKSLAELELILNENLDARAQVLIDRSVYRTHLAEQIKESDNEVNLKFENQEKSLQKSLRNLAADDRISEQTASSVMKSFGDALNVLKLSHKQDVRQQMAESKKKLDKYRSEGLLELQKKHSAQIKALLERAETSASPGEFLDAAKIILEKQNEEVADFWSGTDKDEASKIKNSHLKLQGSFQEVISKTVDIALNKLKLDSQLTQTDIKSLKREHQLEVGELERIREMEKKLKQAEAREELEAKKKERGKILIRTETELQKISERQEDILQKTLDLQMDVDERNRQRILTEYEHNKSLLNSLMKLERIKQEKLLDSKICDRRSSLHNQCTSSISVNIENRHKPCKEKESRERFEDADMEKEKAKLEHHKEELLQALREKIEEETRILLDKQNESMAKTIGHLQVGHARRQTFLDRQKKLYQRLEHVRVLELELQKEAKKATNVDSVKLDDLLSEYKINLEQLNEKLQTSREKQLGHLKEKLENKRRSQQASVASKYEDKEKEALIDANRNNNSFAGSQMIANSVRKRKVSALERLDSEARIQLQKDREKLNRELQDDLDKCLLEQKQSFLSQIGALINLSPAELQDLVKRSTQKSLKPQKKDADGRSEGSNPVSSVLNSMDPISASMSIRHSPGHSGSSKSDSLSQASPLYPSLSADVLSISVDVSQTEPIIPPRNRKSRRKKRKLADQLVLHEND